MKANKKYTILIDASGAKTIMSINNIKVLYKYIAHQRCNNFYIFIVSDNFLNHNTASENVLIRQCDLLKTLPLRIIWSTLVIPFYSFFCNIDLVFSPFDIGPFFSFKHKLLLAIRNPNFILPPILQTLKYPNIHKVISYLSAKNADLILYPSYFARNKISKHLPPIKSEVIYHGVDLNLWKQQSEKKQNKFQKYFEGKYILFCSPFYKFKNIETLLLAYSEYKENSTDKFKLILVGYFVSIAYKKNIYSLIEKLNIFHDVIFLSKIEIAELVFVYQNASVVVITSLFETFGHMYVEALLSKRPIVCCKTDIAQEILGTYPIYFEAEDHHTLANILINRLYHNVNYDGIDKWVERFNLENENVFTINLFNKLCKN